MPHIQKLICEGVHSHVRYASYCLFPVFAGHPVRLSFKRGLVSPLCSLHLIFNDSDEVYVEIGHVPLPLRTLFLHLKTCKEEIMNLFSNGAGKSFELLECLYLPMNIRTSSTQDPRHDWCGINLPFITGVADVVVAHKGMWRLVGEIKGDQSDGYTQGCYAGQDDEILTMLAIW